MSAAHAEPPPFELSPELQEAGWFVRELAQDDARAEATHDTDRPADAVVTVENPNLRQRIEKDGRPMLMGPTVRVHVYRGIDEVDGWLDARERRLSKRQKARAAKSTPAQPEPIVVSCPERQRVLFVYRESGLAPEQAVVDWLTFDQGC